MSDFRMPSLGADMTSGRLLEWCVRPGDPVRRGDIVAVVDTSKAEIEIEVFEDGVVGELLVAPGTSVPVGTPLATILPAGGDGAAPPERPPPEAGRPRVSPLARRVAAELGVDLAAVEGTGPGGAVTRADVERAAAGAQAAAPPAAPTEPPATAAPTPPSQPRAAAPPAADRRAAMRRAIGDLMARSAREIPHYHLETHVDLTRALAWLEERNAPLPPPKRAIPAALLLAAGARAAARHPQLNGFFVDGAPRPSDRVHLGVALALRGGGLVAPAIHDADRLPFEELMDRLRDLASRARAGTLRQSEMADPTITVTNLGDRGADKVHGVIYAPQVALIGFGAIKPRPWATADGLLGARRTVFAALAADHRASDGHDGGLLLAELDRLLQSPEELA
ncbi:MAG TPA: dihydrolipoamide acetyltransferase family protein [Conexibacter sp.]|nr:dihydrolipoamide acetyltransferase family protein [Conexibacter sp.]